MSHHTGDVSAPSDFDLAATLCGHDVSTEIGRSDARADFRVWDLTEAWAIADHIAAARSAIENSSAVRP